MLCIALFPTTTTWRRSLAVLGILLVVPVATVSADTPPTIAVFDFEMVDTSGEAFTQDQQRRLRLASEEMRKLLAERDGVEPIDIEPERQAIAEAGHLRNCTGCMEPIALRLGADLALLGTVHKVSSLILYIAVTIFDAESGAAIKHATVSIRGDTDTAWLRGVRYIVRNRL
jgi:hypothetical protein